MAKFHKYIEIRLVDGITVRAYTDFDSFCEAFGDALKRNIPIEFTLKGETVWVNPQQIIHFREIISDEA